jgi:hypothetical protein
MADLRVTRKVLAGQPGSKNEQRIYRDKLLNVRYLADGEGRYVKTAEIVIYDRHE